MTPFPNIAGRPTLRVVARRLVFCARSIRGVFLPNLDRSGSVLGRSSFPGEA